MDKRTPDARAMPLSAGQESQDRVRDGDAGARERLATLQEQLYAERLPAGIASAVVLQGWTPRARTATVEHVVGPVNPQGVQIASFKKPTREELRHHFLWRINRARAAHRATSASSTAPTTRTSSSSGSTSSSPRPERATPLQAHQRLGAAARRRRRPSGQGLPAHQQGGAEGSVCWPRLDDPDKHWKFNPGDVDERRLWDY